MEKRHALIFALLITILIATNISIVKTISSHKSLETVKISRIIDGDTLELEDSRKIRLANINAPEKNLPNYNLSINFLQQFLNTTVQLEIIGIEKYGRILGKIYAPDYLNLELVRQGYASKFLVEEKELNIFAEAEKQAIDSFIGIWKKSDHYNCFKSKINEKDEVVTITNNCNNINIRSWTLKDESRKVYEFLDLELGTIMLHTNEGKDNETDVFWNSETNIWNNDRDSLYLFDEKGNLAHYKTYGY